MREQSLKRCPRYKWDTGHMLAIDHIKNTQLRCKDARIKKQDPSYIGYVPESYIQPEYATERMKSEVKVVLPPPPFTSNPIQEMKQRVFDRRKWRFTISDNIKTVGTDEGIVANVISPDGRILGTGISTDIEIAKKLASQNVLDRHAKQLAEEEAEYAGR